MAESPVRQSVGGSFVVSALWRGDRLSRTSWQVWEAQTASTKNGAEKTMSVGKRIVEAVDRLVARDMEGALIPAMIAVDATANKSYPKIKDNNKRFKRFVHSSLDIITRLANIGILIDGGGEFRMNYTHPRMKPTPDGCHPIQDILYQIRCDLLHEAEIPSNTQLTNKLAFGGSPFLLPESVLYGLIAAVVVAPVNRLVSIPPRYTFNVFGMTERMERFCGDKARFLKWFDTARANQCQPGSS